MYFVLLQYYTKVFESPMRRATIFLGTKNHSDRPDAIAMQYAINFV